MLTNNKKIFETAKLYRDMYHNKNQRFFHDKLGYNYRMTNMQAAIGLAQLEKIEKFVKIKNLMGKKYKKNLKDVKGIKLPIVKDYAKSVYWMFTILVNKKEFGIDRDQLMKELKKNGVDTRTTFISLNKQPPLSKWYKHKQFPISEKIEETGMYLPSGLAINEKQIDYVCTCIKKIHKKYK